VDLKKPLFEAIMRAGLNGARLQDLDAAGLNINDAIPRHDQTGIKA